jgi:2-C-methyl-D-erythritol 4-phosphate cytidylyltransferase
LTQTQAPTIAVVFAGGKGTRLANQTQPKQFVEVGGKPIIAWTLQLFENSSAIDAIYVVSIDSHLDLMKELIAEHGFSKVKQVAAGGDYAMESIFIGLNLALADNQPEDAVVLIHDGVRPIINAELIDRIVASVATDGNAVTSRPAYETLASSKDQGATVSTVTERSEMFTLQAPQAFRLGPIQKAHLLSKQEGLHDRVVDQAHLISLLQKEKIDQTLTPLRLVEGLVGNIKITTSDDINYFEFLLQSGKYQELTQGTNNRQ